MVHFVGACFCIENKQVLQLTMYKMSRLNALATWMSNDFVFSVHKYIPAGTLSPEYCLGRTTEAFPVSLSLY